MGIRHYGVRLICTPASRKTSVNSPSHEEEEDNLVASI